MNKGWGEQAIFSFEGLILSLTCGHILGAKPSPSGYTPHSSDEGSLEEAQELHLADFAKVATGMDDYVFPPTLSKNAIATILVDSVPAGMMKFAVTRLVATGIVVRQMPSSTQDEELVGLSCAAFDGICKLNTERVQVQDAALSYTPDDGQLIASMMT